MANWGESFAQSFMTAQDRAAQSAMEKWKYERELAASQKDYDLKASAEARRAKEGGIRTDLLQKKQAIIEQILGGGGVGGEGGGQFPAGSTFSIGGLNMPLNRKYSETESKSLSGAGALLKDLNELKTMFTTGKVSQSAQGLGGIAMGASNVPFVGGTISAGAMGLAGLKDKDRNRQNYVDLSRNIANRLLYLRSGAQINEQEYKRFMAQLPALMRNDKLDVKQLNRFIDEFSALEGRISTGALWDKGGKKFVGGKEPTSINLDTLFDGLGGDKEETE